MSMGGNPIISLDLDREPNLPQESAREPRPPAVLDRRHDAILPAAAFAKTLHIEQKRTERSGRPFLLMLLEGENLDQPGSREEMLQSVLSTLTNTVRESDVVGWFKDDFTVGVIFTEVSQSGAPPLAEAILAKVVAALRKDLGSQAVDSLDISLHVFPDAWQKGKPGSSGRANLYPDLHKQNGSRRVQLGMKRALDIIASGLGLLLLSPLFAVIAAIIKLTSKGPVLFRQARVGRLGKEFTFLKFRTMYASNSSAMHKEYVRRFITGKANSHKDGNGDGRVFKLVHDPRITPVGRLLRRASLDELPQLLNVLKGEMSLVGPRPPIPYECDVYELWHRRRVLEAKPGITGLWQVNGRSKVSFDEMVRLDLRYAKSWSLWLDIKILLRTPRAVISAEGAY